jgi:hypothetical protein
MSNYYILKKEIIRSKNILEMEIEKKKKTKGN